MAETMEAKSPSGDILYGEGEANVEASPDSGSEIAEADDTAQEEVAEKLRREREARAQALTLEIVGDLPFAEVKPPENVLFVCKLNPVTEDEDLDLIFSRFGKIISCEVIRDKRTGDSLQYAFIEFENQKDCEQAYFKMQGVLIDDHRIHVDFSQSTEMTYIVLRSDRWWAGQLLNTVQGVVALEGATTTVTDIHHKETKNIGTKNIGERKWATT
ncbi:MAG: hypothetical protein LQ351_000961 [Letrouitia transgressa]|nr:MAG: hypothetical protein LQ351_000961 [Letrouitia transgressa]